MTPTHSQVEAAALLAAADYINGDGDGYLNDTAADNITCVLRKIAAELTRPQEVVGGIKRWTHYEDDFDHFEDPDGDWVTYADHVASHAPEVSAVGPMTSIDDMCAILKRRRINASEYTDCTILYQVTFEQLRAIYDEGRVTSHAPEVVGAGKCYCDHHEHCSVCQPSLWLQKSITATPAAEQGDAKDAARYQLLRRGQHWSVIDGVGVTLLAEALDAAADAVLASKGAA